MPTTFARLPLAVLFISTVAAAQVATPPLTIHFDYQDHRYHFASASGKRIEADPGTFLVRDGKLYLFSSPQGARKN